MSAVTSRGCSRAFILCTLYRALYSVSLQFYDGIPVSYPFNNNDIDKWLTLAKEDCADQEFQDLLGGTQVDMNDSSTFWTQPQQFCTWWKNNIERKKKRTSLELDGEYAGPDRKLSSRALYCRAVLVISENIKSYFERRINKSNEITLTDIPIQMPLHMPEPVPPPILATGPNRSYRKSSRSEDESSLTPPKRKNTKKVESGNNLDTYLQIPATWNGMNSQRVFLTALLPSEINFGDEKYYADQAGASSDNQILVPPKMPRYQDIEYGPGWDHWFDSSTGAMPSQFLHTYEEHCAWFNNSTYLIDEHLKTTSSVLDHIAPSVRLASNNTSCESLEHIPAAHHGRIHLPSLNIAALDIAALDIAALDIAALEVSHSVYTDEPPQEMFSDFSTTPKEYNDTTSFSPVR